MNWLKKLYIKYMKGARANNFPISKYGLFFRKAKNPKTLMAAIYAVDTIVDQNFRDGFSGMSEDSFLGSTHFGLGRWIRNNWGLWKGDSKLCEWFKRQGIHHPDDMSGIILASYYRHKNDIPIKLEEQIQHYKDYWKNQEVLTEEPD